MTDRRMTRSHSTKQVVQLHQTEAPSKQSASEDICESNISFLEPECNRLKEILKAFYEKARPNYEKAKELKPDQKDLWLNGLYRVYYNLQMGPEFEEIEKLM